MDKEKIIKVIKNEQLNADQLGELYWLLNEDQYKEKPVTIEEFCASDDFVHEKWPEIFPIWKDTLHELFPNPFVAPYNEVLISAAAGSGKCHGINTPILLANEEIKLVQDIVPGDMLMGDDGTPRNVLNINKGNELLYKINLEDGSGFVCNKSHILSLRNGLTGHILNLNIEEYLKNKELYPEYFAYKFNDNRIYNFSIEDIGKGDYYGFTIDGNHLYSLADGTITHNTVTATISILYDIYKLGCLKNPCKFYGLAPSTMIIMAIFSATGSTAKVNWQEVTSGIKSCPWIMERLVDKEGLEKKNGSIIPVEIIPGIYIQTGSKFQHSMGKAIFDGLMDEAAFGGSNMEDAKKSYSELSSRIKTRFSKWGTKGNTPGQLFLISSPKDAGDFMQYRIEETQKADSKLTKIMQNISTWEADPSKDSDDKFTVFIGNENKEPCIYEPDQEVPIELMDYLIYPPMSYYDDFKKNLLISIMNYGGITTTSDMALFKSPTALNEVFVLNNPFSSDVITIPFSKTDKTLMDYCNIDYFKNPRHPEYNRFIHIDAAFSTNTLDVYGLAASYSILLDQTTYTGDGSFKDEDIFRNKDKLFFTDFVVGITAPKGQEVPLYKIQNFIEWLGKMNYPIASVSADTFQSKQTLQNLETKGFPTKNISVDRPPEGRDAYIFLRQLVYNKSVLLPKNERAKNELKKLRDDGKKVDHPVGCARGDMVIKLLNDNNKTIKELADLGSDNEFWVYACKQDGTIVPAKAYNAHKTRVAKDLIEITLNNNKKCVFTPEHLFMLKDGNYIEAQNLNLGDNLMSIIDYNKGNVLTYKVKEIKWLYGVNEDVYDITVPGYHNFALASGIIVHNSTKDCADAIAGSIWNCANSTKITNTAKIARQYFNDGHFTPASNPGSEIMEFDRIKQNMSQIFKGL